MADPVDLGNNTDVINLADSGPNGPLVVRGESDTPAVVEATGGTSNTEDTGSTVLAGPSEETVLITEIVAEVIDVGIPGPQGIQGIQGERGETSAFEPVSMTPHLNPTDYTTTSSSLAYIDLANIALAVPTVPAFGSTMICALKLPVKSSVADDMCEIRMRAIVHDPEGDYTTTFGDSIYVKLGTAVRYEELLFIGRYSWDWPVTLSPRWAVYSGSTITVEQDGAHNGLIYMHLWQC